MTKVKVRGIYATSLSKFLKNNGFEIVGSSEEISERLDTKKEGEPDVLIRDKKDKDGVEIKGEKVEEIVEILKDNFPFIIMKKKSPGTLYKGVVFKIEEGRAKVELGGKMGILYFEDSDRYLEPGDELIVQEKGKKDSMPLLTTQLRFFAKSLVLIENGYNKVSKSISDREERERLKKLSREVELGNLGVLWKNSAQEDSNSELKEEIDELLEKKEEILRKAEEMEKPGLIKTGKVYYQIDFGLETKKELDKIRREVVPTVKNHHSLKSGNYSKVVDLTETFLKEIGPEANDILQKFLKERKYPKEGDTFKIEHIKPDDRIYIRGEVKEVKGKEITIKREMDGKGDYDGLEVDKKEGDYAISYLTEGASQITHEYYSKEGELKGEYISINTGIEIFPWYAKYFDLGVDVVMEDGETDIIDVGELKEMKEKGQISQKLFNEAMERSKKIKRRIAK